MWDTVLFTIAVSVAVLLFIKSLVQETKARDEATADPKSKKKKKPKKKAQGPEKEDKDRDRDKNKNKDKDKDKDKDRDKDKDKDNDKDKDRDRDKDKDRDETRQGKHPAEANPAAPPSGKGTSVISNSTKPESTSAHQTSSLKAVDSSFTLTLTLTLTNPHPKPDPKPNPGTTSLGKAKRIHREEHSINNER
jgi:hypothetical protein